MERKELQKLKERAFSELPNYCNNTVSYITELEIQLKATNDSKPISCSWCKYWSVLSGSTKFGLCSNQNIKEKLNVPNGISIQFKYDFTCEYGVLFK